MRPLLSLAAIASLLLAQAPVMAEDKSEDLGLMSVNLKDVVKADFGIQGQTQGAGVPNEVGVGGFLPLSVGSNDVFFLDVLGNVNFSDFSGYSSIINTQVAGVTVSTSSRLGYRWLNSDRSWMFGFNTGYDSRPMNTGDALPYHPVSRRNRQYIHPRVKYPKNPQEVFFQQVAAEVEAVSSTWNFNAYALVPFGDIEQRLNTHYNGGALYTYGGNVAYFITPEINASVGYYYQQGDNSAGNSSGVKGRLAFEVADGVELGGTYTYDDAFESRASADLAIRFGGGSHKKQSKAEEKPQIKKLSATPGNRDVRVHDDCRPEMIKKPFPDYYGGGKSYVCTEQDYNNLQAEIEDLKKRLYRQKTLKDVYRCELRVRQRLFSPGTCKALQNQLPRGSAVTFNPGFLPD